MKIGTMTFTTTGQGIQASFTDHLGKTEQVLSGYSGNDCYDALMKMLLLMQHRNGVENYNSDGTVSGGNHDPQFRAQLQAIADADSGRGWGR